MDASHEPSSSAAPGADVQRERVGAWLRRERGIPLRLAIAWVAATVLSSMLGGVTSMPAGYMALGVAIRAVAMGCPLGAILVWRMPLARRQRILSTLVLTSVFAITVGYVNVVLLDSIAAW